MKNKFDRNRRLIFGILMVSVFTIINNLKSVEGAISGGNWSREGKTLTENEAEEVLSIWRVIGNQEIVTWDGKEWLSKTDNQKREAIEKVCEAWKKAGYQKIKSIKYFIEDTDKYYVYYERQDSKEGLKSKVGLGLSLSAFFAGMEKK